jgi:hypothetical protein
VFRCDLAAQSWESVGPTVETRPLTLQDCLFDGERLYIVSHMRSGSNGPAWLSRYSWDRELRSWSLDAGYPTEVMDRKAETVVIDKDTRGRIWATWEDAQRIWVNRTVGDDRTWGVPFELPGQGNDVTKDDICALGSFGGKIGVMWSNQNDRKFYFAVHEDGDPDDAWTREEALGGAGLETWADDHISLKIAQCDGCVFAVVKTDLNAAPTDPSVYLLRRDPRGGWSRSVVATHDDAWTRATLVLDREHRRLHVFAQSDEGVVGGAIRVDREPGLRAGPGRDLPPQRDRDGGERSHVDEAGGRRGLRPPRRRVGRAHHDVLPQLDADRAECGAGRPRGGGEDRRRRGSRNVRRHPRG